MLQVLLQVLMYHYTFLYIESLEIFYMHHLYSIVIKYQCNIGFSLNSVSSLCAA